jgi:hypothetical protein
MTHAGALRLIGQSLEAVKLQVFELETVGPNYVVRSKFLTKADEWIFRHTFNVTVAQDGSESTAIRSISFSPTDLARLEDRGQKQNTSRDKEDHTRLSGLLHTLGNHLDRSQAKIFQISWMHDSASVDYQFANGQSESRTFTAARLEQIGLLSRFGTSGRTRFTSKSP